MNETDLRLLRRTFEIAERSKANGNHPFGSLLADENGNILLEAENSVVTEKDCTGHAETNLMRMASQKYDPEFLAKCSLYSCAEPCVMCSGAMFWGNVRRLVYGLSLGKLFAIIQDHPENPSFYLDCRDVFAKAPWPIEILGPALEEEASQPHLGFWR